MRLELRTQTAPSRAARAVVLGPILAASLVAPSTAQDLPTDLPSCAAHGLTMGLIYFREAQIEGPTENRTLYQQAGFGMHDVARGLWAEEMECALPQAEADDTISAIGSELLAGFDDAIAGGADPSPLRGYFLASWQGCLEMIGRETYGAMVHQIVDEGLPCDWEDAQ